MNNIFKILNTETGLYSGGGFTPTFNKKGKSWNARGHAIASLMGMDASYETSNLVLVEYTMQEVERKSITEILQEKYIKDLASWEKKRIALEQEIKALPKEAWIPKNDLAGTGAKMQERYNRLLSEQPSAKGVY